MVGTFRSKALEELYQTGKTRRISPNQLRKCIRILALLDAAQEPEEMNIAGLRFHALRGTPQRCSVRVNANYRITFGWLDKSAIDIDHEDYH